MEELIKRTKEEERRVMAEKLLADGFSTELVVKYTGLRKASVEKMRREIETK